MMVKMWGKKTKYRHAGRIRQNQLITAFGVGAIVDFVADTVMIAGLDGWDNAAEFRIVNENLQSLTGVKYFVRPKTEHKKRRAYEKSNDIPAYRFPEKLWCPNCKKIFDVRELENQSNPRKCFACKSPKPLVGSRFVLICDSGHIEDFPYSWWVHGSEGCSSGKNNPRIKMANTNSRSSINSLYITCVECGKSRPIVNAFAPNAFAGKRGYSCKSRFPHLANPGCFADQACLGTLRAVVRSSTSVYFPVVVSALSIPPWSRRAVEIISRHFQEINDTLQFIDTSKIGAYLASKFAKFTNEKLKLEHFIEAFELVKSRRIECTHRTEKVTMQEEYKELCKGDYLNDDGDFSIFTVPIPSKYQDYFAQIVVADRLTETQALYGFTRVTPYSGSLDDPRIVPLAMYKTEWLPAVQLKGEGIFILFNEEKLAEWTNTVNEHYQTLGERLQESYLKNERFSSQYILLHSFAHILIRQIANDCGYNVASLKEKIYSTFYDDNEGNQPMAGILIYLTTADADGSLGGLINLAIDSLRLETVIDAALQEARWCSADPLCITSTEQGVHSLNYAACHDCMLLPETSCEFRNVLLDRAAIIGTPDDRARGFFICD